jgi:hypothetical protein
MPEVRFIEHTGKRVLLMDFSHSDGGPELIQTAGQAMEIVRSTGVRHSILGLLDLTGTPLNRSVRAIMKKMSANNGPYMKEVAFVGMGVVLSPIFRGLLFVTKRKNHGVFDTRREALEWLTANPPSQ